MADKVTPFRTTNKLGGEDGEPPMGDRVTRLETHFEYIQRDLGDIKGALSDVGKVLPNLATRRDLWAWLWQWIALGAAIIAIVVGGIIGGLSVLQSGAQPSTPVTINVAKSGG